MLRDQSSGWRVAIFAGFSLFVLGSLGLWAEGMSTVALMATAVFICTLIGLPMGILAAKFRSFGAISRPVLDGMQTIPSFVYLIPAIMFFGIGNVPGILATVIFALAPSHSVTPLFV